MVANWRRGALALGISGLVFGVATGCNGSNGSGKTPAASTAATPPTPSSSSTASPSGSSNPSGAAPTTSSSTIPTNVPPTSGARTFPDTTSSIAILADQLPSGMTAAQVQFAATHFVGSQKLTLPITQSLRALAPGFLVLHYHLAMWQSAPAVDFIVDGTNWSNDYPTVTMNESWFWHDAQNKRVASTADGKLLMNVSDPGFAAYWQTSIAQQAQLGQYDGVFLDSAAPSLLQGETTDPALAGTSASTGTFAQLGNVSYSTAWGAWISALDDSLGKAGFPLIPNVGPLVTSWDTTAYGQTAGVFSEGFADPSFAPADWKSATNQLVALANAGKIVMLQNYLSGNAGGLARRRYFLANYLLVKAAHVYLDYFANGPLEWYPEWGLDLGAPQTSAVQSIDDLLDPSGVYRRDFAKGIVLVNPTAAAITVNLGASFNRVVPSGGGAVDASGNAGGSLSTTAVSQISVPAASAEILLR